MKRLLHSLTGILVVVTPLVGGGVLMYGNAVNTSSRDMLFHSMQNSPVVGVIAGLVLLLIGLIYLSTFGPARPRKRFISFESDNGEVSISINAVRDFIRKLGDEFSSVISLDPQIRYEKKMVSVELNVKVQTGSRIPELSKLLQGRVRESLRDGLGIADVREIKVKIQQIAGAPLPASEERE